MQATIDCDTREWLDAIASDIARDIRSGKLAESDVNADTFGQYMVRSIERHQSLASNPDMIEAIAYRIWCDVRAEGGA